MDGESREGGPGGPGGDGEVTVACGGRGRKARFQAQAKSECLVGPVVPAVIWVRPGLERQGPDRPRARSFQRQGGTWGRWRLRRGCKASQWGGDKGRRGSRGEPRPHLSWERAVRERGRNRPPERGAVKAESPVRSTLEKPQDKAGTGLVSARPRRLGARGGPARPSPLLEDARGWGRASGPPRAALGRGPRDLPVARPPLAASPPAPERQLPLEPRDAAGLRTQRRGLWPACPSPSPATGHTPPCTDWPPGG